MEHQTSRWQDGTPEQILVEAFDTLKTQNGRLLAKLSTTASLRAFAENSSLHKASTDISDGDISAILQQAITRVPQSITAVMRCRPLGHVLESPTLAHVVFRITYMLPDGNVADMPPEPQVATLEREGETWRLSLDEWSHAGIPGLRNAMWHNEDSASIGA